MAVCEKYFGNNNDIFVLTDYRNQETCPKLSAVLPELKQQNLWTKVWDILKKPPVQSDENDTPVHNGSIFYITTILPSTDPRLSVRRTM